MDALKLETFKLDLDHDGILTALLDVPGRSVNTITRTVLKDLDALVEHLRQDAGIKGLVLGSAKASGFCAGADLGEMDEDNSGAVPSDEAAVRAELDSAAVLNKPLRKLETCGKPVAAAINGVALGGGLELLLAAHYRVAANLGAIQLGLPEITLGLLPGGGGTQRLPRLIGIEKALPLLQNGKPVNADKALKLGLVDALVESGAELAAAKAWILADGVATQPWDRKGFRLPGGGPYQGVAMTMAVARMRATTFGNSPAALNLLKCVYEGTIVPIDAGLRIETRYFVLTRNTPQAKAMVRSLFLSMQELKKRSIPAAEGQRREVKKLAVLGAGMMGAGIAQVCARAGIEVVLLDRSEADAVRGKTGVESNLAKLVDKGRMTREQADALLARITTTADYAQLRGSDFVIEAVFEDRKVKAEVFARAGAELDPDAVLASNTSELPITELAEGLTRPENFIGTHFFSPVDRMGLVEVIRGRRTSELTLARTIDLIRKIRKTAIIVNDARGFYTSRTVHTYLEEGFELLAEGVAPAIIDNLGRAIGMPRGPLEISDDVGLDLCHSARKQVQADLGAAFVETNEDRVLRALVEAGQRHGRKNGKGFYDYSAAAGGKTLWHGLTEHFPVRLANPTPQDVEDIRDRLLYRQSLEAARVFAEGVVKDPRDADVGALLGWGFPAWTGGPLSLIDQVGSAAFVRRCDALADKYGARFAVPDQLREMAAKNGAYYQTVSVRT